VSWSLLIEPTSFLNSYALGGAGILSGNGLAVGNQATGVSSTGEPVSLFVEHTAVLSSAENSYDISWFGVFGNSGPGFLGTSASFQIEFSAYAGPVAAIPEPETYAMLLAGLSLLGIAARRRKQKDAACARAGNSHCKQ
jgi:hypothetical protein